MDPRESLFVCAICQTPFMLGYYHVGCPRCFAIHCSLPLPLGVSRVSKDPAYITVEQADEYLVKRLGAIQESAGLNHYYRCAKHGLIFSPSKLPCPDHISCPQCNESGDYDELIPCCCVKKIPEDISGFPTGFEEVSKSGVLNFLKLRTSELIEYLKFLI